MKLSIDIKTASSAEWLDAVMNDFDTFLQDHADCERKASSMAMSFVAKCPDKVKIIPDLIDTAREELEHFAEVYQIMEKRGVMLPKNMPEDPYINKLLKFCRSSPEERLLDRMLLASIIECRGAERFKMIWNALKDQELKDFYHKLWTSEAKHGNIFVKLAMEYYTENEIYKRLHYLNDKEAEVLQELPIRAALH